MKQGSTASLSDPETSRTGSSLGLKTLSNPTPKSYPEHLSISWPPPEDVPLPPARCVGPPWRDAGPSATGRSPCDGRAPWTEAAPPRSGRASDRVWQDRRIERSTIGGFAWKNALNRPSVFKEFSSNCSLGTFETLGLNTVYVGLHSLLSHLNRWKTEHQHKQHQATSQS